MGQSESQKSSEWKRKGDRKNPSGRMRPNRRAYCTCTRTRQKYEIKRKVAFTSYLLCTFHCMLKIQVFISFDYGDDAYDETQYIIVAWFKEFLNTFFNGPEQNETADSHFWPPSVAVQFARRSTFWMQWTNMDWIESREWLLCILTMFNLLISSPQSHCLVSGDFRCTNKTSHQ